MKLLFIDRYFYPDLQATSCLLTDICQALSEEHEVTVVSGMPSNFRAAGQAGAASLPARETYGKVRILRVRSTDFDKENLFKRFLNFSTFYFSAFWQSITLPRQDLSLVMTSPPLVGMVACLLKLLRGTGYVYVCQDIFPDSVVIPGRLKNRFLIAVFDWCNRLIMRNSLRVVALSDLMKKRIAAKGVKAEKISVIPNWTDAGIVSPLPKDNPFSREQGVQDKFTLVYAGNLGFSHHLEDLVYAAKHLSGLRDIVFLIIGDGACKKSMISLARDLRLENVIFLPYQGKEVIASALAAADVLLITLNRGLGGYVVPSRIYGFLSAGRPLICVMDREAEAATMVKEADCGSVVMPGEPLSLSQEIESLYRDRQRREKYAANAARYARERNFRKSSLESYRILIRDIAQKKNV